MGSPLGPSLANIFLSYHERKWLSNCPELFKPIHYYRYVDDTFIIFKDNSHIPLFLSYLNRQHANIKFTCDIETNCSLPFLDCSTLRSDNKIETSIYRKATFSGLCTSFFSFCDIKFKLNSIKTLIHRSFHLSSSYINFHEEIDRLRTIFTKNSYPVHLFNSILKNFLSKQFSDRPQTQQTVNKLSFYHSLPYYDSKSSSELNNLSSLLSAAYPHIEFKFVYRNKFNIGSFFNCKDRLPVCIRSNVIYKFLCDSCNASYVGCTRQHFKTRIYQHLGISPRTNRPFSSPMHSTPRDHAINNNHPIKTSNFTIIGHATAIDLNTVESMHIAKLKPVLNNMQSSTPLFITPDLHDVIISACKPL